MNLPATPAAPIRHSAWKIWSNPIFRRYCRSRLRLRGLGISLLIVVMVAGFIFAATDMFSVHQAKFAELDGARSPILPLLIFQGLILFVMGTAQVSGGMVAERDEGVIDYQRLIPMPPSAKVFGYLFGLPVREYVLVLATLPFTAWCLWKGEVALGNWLPLYAVFFSSALLYHFTGLLTGTVVKNRRWAFLISIGLVFALYTVIPQMARFGLVFFKYLTIEPVYEECKPGLWPKTLGAMVEVGHRLAPSVKFFNLDFSETVFTLFSQGGLVLTFLAMLTRKWRRTESHLLGKIWATVFFVWIQVLLLGNALPLVATGDIFFTHGFNQGLLRFGKEWEPQAWEATCMSGLYGLVTLLLLFILGGLITPSPMQQMNGWRRARKNGRDSLEVLSDPATGSWFVLVMALAGAVGWYLFTRGVIESRWFPGHQVPLSVLGWFAAVMVSVGLGYQVLLESRGAKVVGLVVILGGVAPLMIGTVMCAINTLAVPAVWFIGMSPVSLPVYAAGSQLSVFDLPDKFARAVPRAFQFWLFVVCLTTVWLSYQLYVRRRAIARKVMESGTPLPSAEPASLQTAIPEAPEP